jgi:ribosome maturation factor RimP
VTKDLGHLLETTIAGLGYDLVHWERAGRGLLRVFIERAAGGVIDVEDCARVSRHLTRVFAVEGVAYDRLEISSPGLDRPLKTERDFVRFAGEKASVRMRVPLDGRRNFVGILRSVHAGTLQLEVEGETVDLQLRNLERARLIPDI